MAIVERLGRLDDGDALVRVVHAECLHAAGDPGAQAAIVSAAQRVQRDAEAISDLELRGSFLAVPENHRTLELAKRWTGA